ncbi:MAG: hypothetical protein RDV48_21625 [Candidatus Eremiobacteraeota bacterium]|nr:hypothetical protein [Candidatus Eremiobacteraeota bacterium]
MAEKEFFDKNVGYGDAGEENLLEMENEKRKTRPSVSEMLGMCRALGLECDPLRDISEDDAWAYYRELKALLEAKQRKSA